MDVEEPLEETNCTLTTPAMTLCMKGPQVRDLKDAQIAARGALFYDQ